MPKMKTNKSAAKRFKVKKSGKVQFKVQGLRHILTGWSRKTKRQKKNAGYIESVDMARIRDMMPYH